MSRIASAQQHTPLEGAPDGYTSLSSPARLRGRILTLAVGLAASSLALGACASSTQTASVDDDGAAASHGEISVQYSWIKNEEFAGEFYAYENGYYDEAGFADVIGISGPDTGVAKLLSGHGAGRSERRRVDRRRDRRAGRAAQDHRRDVPEEPVHDPVARGRRQHRRRRRTSSARRSACRTPTPASSRRSSTPTASTRPTSTVVPVDFDPTPLMNGDVDGFMAYLTNEAHHGRARRLRDHQPRRTPRTACRTSPRPTRVTDQYLAENKDLLKAFLIAEIKGWTDVFKEPTDDTVDADHEVLQRGRVRERRRPRGRLRRPRPGEDRHRPRGREGAHLDRRHRGERPVHDLRRAQGADGRLARRRRLGGLASTTSSTRRSSTRSTRRTPT